MEYSVPFGWYEGVYQDSRTPFSAARPFSLVHEEKAGRAVLLIHGYAGYPGELVRPARDLYESGFDAYVPRLPGCGTSGEDFSRSRRNDWVRLAVNAAMDLRTRYSELYIVGHSMGAAIAVEAAAKASVKRLVLAAPAIGSMKPPKPLPVIYLYSLLKKRIPTPWHHQSEFVMYYENAPADDEGLGREYWSWVYLRQIYELYRLVHEAGNVLSGLDADILTISCGRDMIVGERTAEEIAALGSGKREHVHIPECTHYLFYDPDKDGEEKAVRATVSFLLG